MSQNSYPFLKVIFAEKGACFSKISDVCMNSPCMKNQIFFLFLWKILQNLALTKLKIFNKKTQLCGCKYKWLVWNHCSVFVKYSLHVCQGTCDLQMDLHIEQLYFKGQNLGLAWHSTYLNMHNFVLLLCFLFAQQGMEKSNNFGFTSYQDFKFHRVYDVLIFFFHDCNDCNLVLWCKLNKKLSNILFMFSNSRWQKRKPTWWLQV